MQDLGAVLTDRIERNGTLLARVAPHDDRLILVEVAWTDLEPERNAAQLPLVILRAGLDALAIIDVHAQPPGRAALPGNEAFLDERGRGADASLVLVRPPDRDDHNLDRSEERRNAQSVVVAVRHDEPANHAGGYAPARVPGVFHSAFLSLELEVERLREILTEVVRRA